MSMEHAEFGPVVVIILLPIFRRYLGARGARRFWPVEVGRQIVTSECGTCHQGRASPPWIRTHRSACSVKKCPVNDIKVVFIFLPSMCHRPKPLSDFHYHFHLVNRPLKACLLRM